MSWLAQILPQVDQRHLFDTLDFTAGAYGERNARARRTSISTYLCPSDFRVPSPGQAAASSYAGVHHDAEAAIDHGNHGAFVLNLALPREAVTDGLANTVFVGEKVLRQDELGWLSGTRATLRNGRHRINDQVLSQRAQFPTATDAAANPPDPVELVGGFASAHDAGAYFLIGDGSGHFLNQNIDRDLFRRLTNRSDGESRSEAFD
jgi:hypothetical protein